MYSYGANCTKHKELSTYKLLFDSYSNGLQLGLTGTDGEGRRKTPPPPPTPSLLLLHRIHMC